MFPSRIKRPGLVAVAGLVAILGIPLSRWWWSDHGKHPQERLERERREERAAMQNLAPIAAADLGCADTRVEPQGLEIWATGCGKHARYVLLQGTWRREGDVLPESQWPASPDQPGASTCRERWTRRNTGTARAVAEETLATKKVVRVRVPPASLGFVGFAKLRYGDAVEVRIAEARALDAPVAPCAEDGSAREATCPIPWDAVVEVADCD